MGRKRIACDSCGAVREEQRPTTDHEALREALRKVGWLCVDDTDVCPACRSKLAEEVAST